MNHSSFSYFWFERKFLSYILWFNAVDEICLHPFIISICVFVRNLTKSEDVWDDKMVCGVLVSHRLMQQLKMMKTNCFVEVLLLILNATNVYWLMFCSLKFTSHCTRMLGHLRSILSSNLVQFKVQK